MAALERCAAVFGSLTGDLAKKAPGVRLRWHARATAGDVCISYGALKAAPAALDAIEGLALHGEADINVDPRKLMRLLHRLDAEPNGEDIILLQAGRHPGDALRIDAGADRFAALGQIREFSHVEQEAA
jgi:hypothetical protein